MVTPTRRAGVNNGGTLTVSDCVVSNNAATYGGGGIGNNGGNVTISNCTFNDNSASNNYGGGIYSFYGAVTISGSTFTGNSAGDGGGICIFYANVTATDSTFAGNVSILVGGGGVYNDGALTLTNGTLSGNSAIPYNLQGGGIANAGGTSTLINTIVANSPSGGDLVGSSGSYSGANDLIDDTSAGTDGSNGYFGASSLYDVAAGLDSNGLQDNGGPTPTVALLPGSPALDAGTGSGAPATDQRGVSRPQGSGVDIRGLRVARLTMAISGGDGQGAVLGSAFAQPLAVTVSSPYGEPVAGGQVTFAAPTSGASALLSGTTATIGSDGQASVTASANDVLGRNYPVTASAAGAAAVSFALSNVAAMPTLSTTPGGTVAIDSGNPLTDSATLSGGFNPTGTISFTLYAPTVPRWTRRRRRSTATGPTRRPAATCPRPGDLSMVGPLQRRQQQPAGHDGLGREPHEHPDGPGLTSTASRLTPAATCTSPSPSPTRSPCSPPGAPLPQASSPGSPTPRG